MAATEWYSYAYLNNNPARYLLTDGTVLTEPRLQESGSGRRVRVEGHRVSHPYKENPKVRYTGLWHEALRRGQRVLCRYYNTDDGVPTDLQVGSLPGPPRLHILDNPSSPTWHRSSAVTVYWWLFRCEEMPLIHALVKVVISDESNAVGKGARRRVSTEMVTTRLMPSAGAASRLRSNPKALLDTPVASARDSWFDSAVRTARSADSLPEPSPKWEKLTGAEPGTMWPFYEVDDPTETINSDKTAIRDLVGRVRKWDGVEYFRTPNFAKAVYPEVTKGQPNTWKFTLVHTNVTPQVISDLTAMLASSDAVAEAVEHYQAMRAALRRLGLVLSDVRGSDLLKLLGNQGGGYLRTDVTALLYSADDPKGAEGADGLHERLPTDRVHTLSIDLLTGRFIISCPQEALSNPDILNLAADRWQEAVAIESITHTEHELLAAARIVAQQEQARAREIIERAR